MTYDFDLAQMCLIRKIFEKQREEGMESRRALRSAAAPMVVTGVIPPEAPPLLRSAEPKATRR
jgi:hypothetical protein